MNYNWNEPFKTIHVNGDKLNNNLCRALKGRLTEILVTDINPNFKHIDQEYDVLNTETGARMELKGMNGCLFTSKNKKKAKTGNIIIKNWQGGGAYNNSNYAYDKICSNFDEFWIVDTKNYGAAMISSEDLRNKAIFKEKGDHYSVQIFSEDLTYLCTPHDIDVSMTEEERTHYNKMSYEKITSLFRKQLGITIDNENNDLRRFLEKLRLTLRDLKVVTQESLESTVCRKEGYSQEYFRLDTNSEGELTLHLNKNFAEKVFNEAVEDAIEMDILDQLEGLC
tara:strand:+ start:538 stop:1380 length:843 start_codon:yes stop_codon:yes gene_type:complete